MWQRTHPPSLSLKSSVRSPNKKYYSRLPFQNVIVDNEGIDVRKLDDFFALWFVRLTLLDPIHIRTAQH
jgi:hypothetical protein